ncbi:SDR family NAD(P)-dependent oxidoreductase [Actinoplanes sp. G11-F43]|uniref:SDR family NAD(P)-dependent oxidoreductase n=1 Tax=Actinoplanes sp. G11-F43 TaxID=3424130 RepID=UPI003D355C72
MTTIVITGASSGIGAAAARRLAARGMTVAVVGRSAQATAAVAAETGGIGFTVDFTRFDDVRRLAGELLDRLPRIDVLANNAGMGPTGSKLTENGHETGVQVNFLSPFLLTNLLLDRLAEAPDARVVNTSSSLYRFGRLDPDDLGGTGGYAGAKLANILHAAEIEKRTPANVRAVAFHPGTVRSGLARQTPAVGWVQRSAAGRRFTRSPEEGAEPLVHLATVATPATGYFDRLTPRPVRHRAAADPAFGARLWERAAALTDS